MTGESKRLLGGEALGDALFRLCRAVEPRRTIRGWATVELDRAEVEVAADLAALGVPRVEAAPDEQALGARCRLLSFQAGTEVLLLEPSTEGRLAAALARYGEGYLALYLLTDSGAPGRACRAGFTLTVEGGGPFGAERLVLAAPRHGPFLALAGLD